MPIAGENMETTSLWWIIYYDAYNQQLPGVFWGLMGAELNCGLRRVKRRGQVYMIAEFLMYNLETVPDCCSLNGNET